jgi:hypothetical protein
LPDIKIERFNGCLSGLCFLGGGDIDKCPLIRGTGECTEEGAEVVPTGRASGKEAINGLEVVAKCVDLVRGAADRTLCVFGATNADKKGACICIFFFWLEAKVKGCTRPTYEQRTSMAGPSYGQGSCLKPIAPQDARIAQWPFLEVMVEGASKQSEDASLCVT